MICAHGKKYSKCKICRVETSDEVNYNYRPRILKRTRGGALDRENVNICKIERSDKISRKNNLVYSVNSTDMMPLCLRKSASGFTAVGFEDAEYVWIDTVNARTVTTELNYIYMGVSFAALAIASKNKTFYYYKVNQGLSNDNANLVGRLSRYFADDDVFYHNAVTDMANITLPFLWEKHTDGRLKMSDIKGLRTDMISGDHHVHYTAIEILRCVIDKARAYDTITRLPADVTTTFVAGVLLWTQCLGHKLYDMVVKAGLLNVDSMIEFGRRGKQLSVRCKSFQHIVNVDLKPLFEVDVLVNRQTGIFDWGAEKEHRTKPNLAKLSPEIIYQRAVEMFMLYDARAEKPRRLDWKEFWDARWQWSASGSIHSQYDEDMLDVPSEREFRNKFIALNIYEDSDMNKYSERSPGIVAWSSIKYEWGKMRAIYGTDLTSYILANFAFYNIEDTLPSMFPIGKKANESYVKRRVAAVLRDRVPLCLDFEDFNSQHSLEGMKAVMFAWLDTKRKHLSDEQIEAALWSISAIDNTVIRDNMGTGTEYKVNGTLMSGWRLTTFVNSVLNYIYTQHVFGKHAEDYHRSVHNGDDVLLGVNNLESARRAVKMAANENIRLQLSKCSFGSLAEFLRIDHASGDSGQYITRSIATLMHSRIESKVAVRHKDLVEAMEERFADFVNRGGRMDIVCNMREVYHEKIDTRYSRGNKSAGVIKQVHRVAGGISSNLDSRVDVLIEDRGFSEESKLPTKMPGIDAYSKVIHTSLQLPIKIGEVSKSLRTATLKAVQLKTYYTEVVQNADHSLYKVYKALYKAHHNELDKKEYGKAKLVGLLIDVLNKEADRTPLARLLAESRDPMKFISVTS